MNKITYGKAAKEAYANCLELLKDANILYAHKRYPRAFALGVLSCEEFAKSFLYKCVASGIITDPNYYHEIKLHDLKLYHFMNLIVSNYGWRRIEKVRKKTRGHDKKFKDHSKHILPRELDKIEPEATRHVLNMIKSFRPINELKFAALYVDIMKNKILRPTDFMKKRGCYHFLNVLGRYLSGFDVILSMNEKEFKKTVEMLDPDILLGTFKPRISKVRRM